MKKELLKFDKKKMTLGLPTRAQVEKSLDDTVSLVVRYRDRWTCQNCGARYTPNKKNADGSFLTASHYIGRTHRATRWDLDDLDSLCAKMGYNKGGLIMARCHGRFEREKNGEYRRFKLNRLGKAKVERLELLSGTTFKISVPEMLVLKSHFQKKLDEYKKEFERGQS